MTKVTVKSFSANTTSVLQPCDQEIVRALKAHFQNQLRQIIIDSIDDIEEEILANDIVKKVNVLYANHMLHDAWDRVLLKIIQNCWKKGGFQLKLWTAKLQVELSRNKTFV